jgi:drug/metabolite transporter (DMT)-like permease
VLFGVLPFFVFGLGHYMIGESTSSRTWIGAVLAFAGVAVISLAATISGSVWYALAAVGAALSSAFANVYAKRHAHHDPLVTLPPSMLLAGTVVALIGFASEHPHVARGFSLPSWGALLYLAVIGSGLPFFLNLWLLRHVAVWIVGLSSLIIPVIAVAVGVVFGGEQFGPRELLGAALVLIGVWISFSSAMPAKR